MKSHGRNNHQRRQQNKNEQRPVNGFVPFFNSLHSRLRIEPQVLNVIAHNLRGFAVVHPLMESRGTRRKVTECPRRIFLDDLDQFINGLGLIRAFVHITHTAEELVVLRILVVRSVLSRAARLGLSVRAVKQEQEIFCIRIVGQPAP